MYDPTYLAASDYVYDAILDAHADWIASRDAAKAGA